MLLWTWLLPGMKCIHLHEPHLTFDYFDIRKSVIISHNKPILPPQMKSVQDMPKYSSVPMFMSIFLQYSKLFTPIIFLMVLVFRPGRIWIQQNWHHFRQCPPMLELVAKVLPEERRKLFTKLPTPTIRNFNLNWKSSQSILFQESRKSICSRTMAPSSTSQAQR